MTISWPTTLDTHTHPTQISRHAIITRTVRAELLLWSNKSAHCLCIAPCIHLNYDQLLSRCNTPTHGGRTAASSLDTSRAVVQALESVKDTRRLLLIFPVWEFSFFLQTSCVGRLGLCVSLEEDLQWRRISVFFFPVRLWLKSFLQ